MSFWLSTDRFGRGLGGSTIRIGSIEEGRALTFGAYLASSKSDPTLIGAHQPGFRSASRNSRNRRSGFALIAKAMRLLRALRVLRRPPHGRQ